MRHVKLGASKGRLKEEAGGCWGAVTQATEIITTYFY
jgi:hypothetical protein